MLRRRALPLLLALATLAGITLTTANPASASTCIISASDNPYTGTSYPRITLTWSPVTNINRTVCYNVAVTGPDASGYYYFRVYAQDMVDVGTKGGNDDRGYIEMFYKTPGSSVWHAASYGPGHEAADTNSADFTMNEQNSGTVWFSPTYHVITDGPPQNFTWRALVWTHWQNAAFIWNWTLTSLPTFTRTA